jgi:hypothetical protein
VAQATIAYRYNEDPNRGLAAAGAAFFIKAVLLIPHYAILGAFGTLSWWMAYVGYWIVVVTGEMPRGISALLDMYLRWSARTTGWLLGITDRYPPFEVEVSGYPFDAEIPRNDDPSVGLAVAGASFLIKILMIIPHAVVLAIVTIGAFFATWAGYFSVLFTGRLPEGIQDFQAGTVQWWIRVMSWLYGLTDEYPPFSLQIRPTH